MGGWQHPRCQQGPSSASSSAGGQQAAASIQTGNKYRTFVTLGPNGHTDTLCKAEVPHLGSCSAACALCAPPACQCLGREPRAGLSKRPQLRQPTAKPSDHSLGLIPAAAELLCAQTSAEADGAWCCPPDRAPPGPPVTRHRGLISSASAWAGCPGACGLTRCTFYSSLFLGRAAEHFLMVRELTACCSQQFVTALVFVTVLQQGSRSGDNRGAAIRLPVTYSRGEASAAARERGGSCQRVVQSQRMEQRVQEEVVQRRAGGDGRMRGGLPGRPRCRVPLSSMHAHACSSAGGPSQDCGTGGHLVGLGGRRAAALCSVRKL